MKSYILEQSLAHKMAEEIGEADWLPVCAFLHHPRQVAIETGGIDQLPDPVGGDTVPELMA